MAGIEVRFRFGAIKDLANNVPHIAPNVEDYLQKVGMAQAERGRDMVRERMRVASGRGQRSVQAKVTGRQFAFGSPLIHVRVMDQGRRPGARMPPTGALLPWMRRKGLDDDAEFGIRKTISLRGIKGDHKFAEVRAELKPIVERKLSLVQGVILDAMAGTDSAVDPK